jgi:two-component system CAI-1 autoinducer sensor kinase/phosphatase CqsS
MLYSQSTIRGWRKQIERFVLRRLLQPQRQLENDHDAARFLFLAWIGCVGMPLYYVVWTVWFPQEFESLDLRTLGLALCLMSLWSRRLFKGRYLRLFQFIAVTYMLPFFFSFMFLMNHGSAVWSQSLLVALIVLFHFEVVWALKSFCCGTLLAVLAFGMVGDAGFLLRPQVLQQLPIFAFTVLVVSCAKIGRRVLAAEKLAGMAQALATVSHELRTPLISVAANAKGIERCLAADPGGPMADRAAVGDAMSRIQFEVRHMNHMIDLFLMSATAMKQQLEPTERISMRDVVDSVIERYPFTGALQRECVSVEMRGDFTFSGKYDLCVVVLLNLLRNALKALQRAGKGNVRIIVDGVRNKPRLLVVDTGCGIAARQLPLIFERFYTYPPSSGSGIGLALCKDIIDAWHGSIRCISRELAYTIFVLEFPKTAQPGATAPIFTKPMEYQR